MCIMLFNLVPTNKDKNQVASFNFVAWVGEYGKLQGVVLF